MPTLANLKSGLQGRIYYIEVLLEAVTTFLTAAQEFEHNEYTQRINDLTLEASAKFLDIEARHGGDIKIGELDTFRASLTNIKHRKSTIYTTLRAMCMEGILERHQIVLDDQRKPGESLGWVAFFLGG